MKFCNLLSEGAEEGTVLVHFSSSEKLCPPTPKPKAVPLFPAPSCLPHTTKSKQKPKPCQFTSLLKGVVDSLASVTESPKAGTVCTRGTSVLLKDLGKCFYIKRK